MVERDSHSFGKEMRMLYDRALELRSNDSALPYFGAFRLGIT